MNEEWRPVPGYNGWYEVSSLGRVRSWIVKYHPERRADVPRVLNQYPQKEGYLFVSLYDQDRKVSRRAVHTLVAEAFVSAKPEGMIVLHDDGTVANNVVGNLKWGTHKENTADRYRHGTMMLGEEHQNAKITEDDVRAMRRLYASGKYSYTELGSLFGITRTNASYIINRKAWKHVA